MSLSVVIVNWNAGLLLEKCIHSLLEHGPECEIIIVDNASTDASLDFVAALGKSVRVLRNSQNTGFAAACNKGWRESRGTLIFFLNPDAEATDKAIQSVVNALEQNQNAWASSGRLISPSGQSQEQYAPLGFPTLASVLAEAFFLDELWPSHPWSRLGRRAEAGEDFSIEIDQAAAACLLVRRSALESLDGFDECFRPAWFEDVDLCKRIQAHGGKILYVPRAHFLHRGGFSLQHLGGESFLRCFHANQIRYFRKHHGKQSARRVQRAIIAGLCLRAAFSLFCPLMPGFSRLECFRAFRKVSSSLSTIGEGST